MKSHSHFFAALHEAWNNLNEADAKRFPTEEHLRHWALIQCGFCNEKTLPCEKPSLAKSVAALIRTSDPYAVIIVKADVVKVLTAKSQSLAAMGAEEFKESKEKILDLVATMARTTRKELAKEATKHAPPEQKPKPAATPTPAKSIGDPYLVPVESSGAWAALPSSPSAYFAYARSWILAATDKELSWQRWDGERDLRDQLRISIPNRRELKGLLTRQFAEAEVAR
jgi:hypothetical protein